MEREKPEEIKKFTKMQEIFLNALFDERLANGDLRKAADIAGYSNKTFVSQIVEPLKEEIVDRTYLHLASNSPKAALRLVGVLDNPTELGNKELMAAAKDILDRGGVIKTEKVDIKVPKNAIFILPEKRHIEEE